jgi:titin
MSPTAVTVRSLSVGTAKASWNPPAYGGGSTITNYVITATAKGKPTVTKTVAGTVKSVSLTGLANATKYTVKIQAKTVKGLSDPYTVIVPVA